VKGMLVFKMFGNDKSSGTVKKIMRQNNPNTSSRMVQITIFLAFDNALIAF